MATVSVSTATSVRDFVRAEFKRQYSREPSDPELAQAINQVAVENPDQGLLWGAKQLPAGLALNVGDGFTALPAAKKPVSINAQDWTTVQSAARAALIAENPQGDAIRAKVRAHVAAFDAYDAVRSALRGDHTSRTSAAYLKKVTPERLRQLGTGLGLPEAKIKAGIDEFQQLFDNPAAAGRKQRQEALLKQFKPPVVAALESTGMDEKRQETNIGWLRSTPASVFQILADEAASQYPASFLYAAAANEGLIQNYVAVQTKKPNPSEADLARVSVHEPIDLFSTLGVDDLLTDLDDKKQRVASFLTQRLDAEKILASYDTKNEHGRQVGAVVFTDLRSGIQVLYAALARREAMFLDAAKERGYAPPTPEERLFHGYTFFNAGVKAGTDSLEQYKPGTPHERKLSKWLSSGLYPNSQKVLDTYRFLKAADILPGPAGS